MVAGTATRKPAKLSRPEYMQPTSRFSHSSGCAITQTPAAAMVASSVSTTGSGYSSVVTSRVRFSRSPDVHSRCSSATTSMTSPRRAALNPERHSQLWVGSRSTETKRLDCDCSVGAQPTATRTRTASARMSRLECNRRAAVRRADTGRFARAPCAGFTLRCRRPGPRRHTAPGIAPDQQAAAYLAHSAVVTRQFRGAPNHVVSWREHASANLSSSPAAAALVRHER